MARRACGWGMALTIAVAVIGCGDDKATEPGPVTPPEVWVRAPVDAPADNGAFSSVAFTSTRGLAGGGYLNVARGPAISPFLATRGADGTWVADPADLPASAILSAVGFVPTGEALVAGIDLDTDQPFVLDERGGWSRHDVDVNGTSFASDGIVVRLAGVGSDQLIWTDAADTWTAESLPFPGSAQERGILDIATNGSVWAACGFDDGGDGTPASPNAVLFLEDGPPWTRLDVPCGGCTNREFRAVEVNDEGAVYLGGAITDFSAGSTDEYVAFLLIRSATGIWTEIVLPNAGGIDRVNDILIASDGFIYLTCGLGDAHVVRAGAGTPPTIEQTFPSSMILRLAEESDGSIWAAGGVANGSFTAFAIWNRPES